MSAITRCRGFNTETWCLLTLTANFSFCTIYSWTGSWIIIQFIIIFTSNPPTKHCYYPTDCLSRHAVTSLFQVNKQVQLPYLHPRTHGANSIYCINGATAKLHSIYVHLLPSHTVPDSATFVIWCNNYRPLLLHCSHTSPFLLYIFTITIQSVVWSYAHFYEMFILLLPHWMPLQITDILPFFMLYVVFFILQLSISKGGPWNATTWSSLFLPQLLIGSFKILQTPASGIYPKLYPTFSSLHLSLLCFIQMAPLSLKLKLCSYVCWKFNTVWLWPHPFITFTIWLYYTWH